MRSKGRKKKRADGDLEDGELTLLNDADDDGISRLDCEDEKPFQSFAVQMHGFNKKGSSSKSSSHSDYTMLNSQESAEETKHQLEQMQQDLDRIKDKEQALDAENKILRA
jgi:hypothetical protein